MRKNLVVFVALAMIMIPSAIGAKVKYDYGIAPHADGGWGGGGEPDYRTPQGMAHLCGEEIRAGSIINANVRVA